VWETCPRFLRGSALAGSRTSHLRYASPTLYQLVAESPRHVQLDTVAGQSIAEGYVATDRRIDVGAQLINELYRRRTIVPSTDRRPRDTIKATTQISHGTVRRDGDVGRIEADSI